MSQVKIENAEVREAVERAKRDHVHEWAVLDSWPDRGEDLQAECFWGWKESGYKVQCPATLDEAEINRRLNATEILSVEDALAAFRIMGPGDPAHEKIRTALRKYYASALEEK